MKKLDFVFAIAAGEGVAWLIWGLLKESQKAAVFGLSTNIVGLLMAIVLPIMSICGLWFTYVVGKKFLFVFHGGKFFLTGVLASLVDLGVLNFLLLLMGATGGIIYTISKSISFLTSTVAKFWVDKLWAFEQTERKHTQREFWQFIFITVAGMVINVGIASVFVNFGPWFGLTKAVWANFSAILAIVAVSIWNFVGYKFVVFKK